MRNFQVISQGIELELVSPQGSSTALQADLVFDPADPFAVSMVFRTAVQEVRWTFGRQLLADGLYEPTGDGDVHVWPCLSCHGVAVVIVELAAQDGDLLVQAGSREVSAFVDRMMTVVPDGHEAAHVDVDSELARILDH